MRHGRSVRTVQRRMSRTRRVMLGSGARGVAGRPWIRCTIREERGREGLDRGYSEGPRRQARAHSVPRCQPKGTISCTVANPVSAMTGLRRRCPMASWIRKILSGSRPNLRRNSTRRIAVKRRTNACGTRRARSMGVAQPAMMRHPYRTIRRRQRRMRNGPSMVSAPAAVR